MMPFFLLGYAVAGRAFAYLGIPPFYMGEILLLLGIWYIASLPRPLYVFVIPQIWLLIVFMLWGVLQTLPYLYEYRIMALRDAVLWGYGFFALIIAMAIVSVPSAMPFLIDRYRFFVRFFPYIAFAGLIVLIFFKRAIFDVTVLMQMKAGDILVHLAAVMTFAAYGLSGKKPIVWFISIIGAVICAGSIGRGGLLAFCVGMSALVLLRIQYLRTWRMLLYAGIAGIMRLHFLWRCLKKKIRNYSHGRFRPCSLLKISRVFLYPPNNGG